jgi:hypothetical protein
MKQYAFLEPMAQEIPTTHGFLRANRQEVYLEYCYQQDM